MQSSIYVGMVKKMVVIEKTYLKPVHYVVLLMNSEDQSAKSKS